MKKGNPFTHALRGIKITFREERNFRIHLILASLCIGLGYWMGLSTIEWLWLGAIMAMVLVAELLNTAIEAVVDLISPGMHPLARKAKDAGAAAVLIAAIIALIGGVFIFGPKLWLYLFP